MQNSVLNQIRSAKITMTKTQAKEKAVALAIYAALGITGLCMAFATSAAGQDTDETNTRKGGLPYHVVERTKADDCVDEKIQSIFLKAQENGQGVLIKGQALDEIKNACEAETGIKLGIYDLIDSVGITKPNHK